jgi:hypothetical protein
VATQTRAPTSDESVTGTWSGVVGSRWTLVDDYPSVATNDLLTGGTTAAVITFGFSAFSIPASSTSISVQVMYFDGEAASGANNCGGRLKVGGAYFNAATHNPAGTAGTTQTDNWATNPQTSAAWTVDQVNGVGANALQAFGMNSTDSNPTWRFSSIQVQVTYSEPSSSGSAATSATTQSSAASGTAQTSGTAASASTAQSASVGGTASVGGSVGTSATAQTSDTDADVTDPSSDITGSVASAAGAQSSAAGGAVSVSGSAATQSSESTVAASGAVRVGGTVASSSSAATNAANGTVSIAGTGASAATNQTSSVSTPGGQQYEPDHGWQSQDRNRRARMGRRR